MVRAGRQPRSGHLLHLGLSRSRPRRAAGVYGRAALEALEPIARELGYDAIALHVFADNDVARSLYRSSGYVETDVSMRKHLG